MEQFGKKEKILQQQQEQPLSWQNQVAEIKESINSLVATGVDKREAGFKTVQNELVDIVENNLSKESLAKARTAIELIFTPRELAEVKNMFEPIEVPPPTEEEIKAQESLSKEKMPEIVLRDIALTKNLLKEIAKRVASREVFDSKMLADIEKVKRAIELIAKHQARAEKIERVQGIEEAEVVALQNLKKVLVFSIAVENSPHARNLSGFLAETKRLKGLLN